MTDQQAFSIIAGELGIREAQVAAVAELLAGEATVPFIARYRKEATGNLDEVAIINIRDRLDQIRELEKRREAILKSLAEQEKLTPELEKAVREAPTLAKLEDIYLPYRPKRRTRATVAREKGLEPLALRLLSQGEFDIDAAAGEFVDAEKGVASAGEALPGRGHHRRDDERGHQRASDARLFARSCHGIPRAERKRRARTATASTERPAARRRHRVLAVLGRGGRLLCEASCRRTNPRPPEKCL